MGQSATEVAAAAEHDLADRVAARRERLRAGRTREREPTEEPVS
jgi:hypothetical protein